MVPGVVWWENLASGPCSPGRVISAGESRSERLWWLGVSRRLPGPKRFLHLSFLKLLWIGEGRKAVVLHSSTCGVFGSRWTRGLWLQARY